MDGGPCGKGAVLLRLLGAEVPGEFDSRTIRWPINNVLGHGTGPGIQSAKRVGSAWRNAVGHTCPMRSRTFLLGVTAAHGSLEPIVLVQNQEEEHNRRLRQPAVGNGLQNRERWVRPPQPPLSGSILRFDFFLYTRTMCCTGHTGFRHHPRPRKRCHRPCSSVDRASVSGTEGRGFDPHQAHQWGFRHMSKALFSCSLRVPRVFPEGIHEYPMECCCVGF